MSRVEGEGTDLAPDAARATGAGLVTAATSCATRQAASSADTCNRDEPAAVDDDWAARASDTSSSKGFIVRRTPRKPRAKPQPRKHPRDENFPENFLDHLLRRVAGFENFSSQLQRDLAYLAWIAGSWQRRHKTSAGYFTIPYQEIQRRFGRDGFRLASAAVAIFEVIESSPEDRATKGYRLTRELAAIVAEYLNEAANELTHVMGTDGKRIQRIPGAIAAKDRKGCTQKAWKDVNVANTVRVDLPRLHRMHDYLIGKCGELEETHMAGDLTVSDAVIDVRYDVHLLAKFLRLAQTHVAGAGYVMMRYTMGKTGRLYAAGISLQTVPRRIRKAALHGMWDYDLENCHYAIIHQMAARFEYEARVVAAYLADKKATRQGIADRVGITYDAVKTCLLAIVYGARLSAREVDAIPKEIGPEAARRLYADPVFSALHRDISKSRKVILSKHPKRNGKLVNAMNLAISVTAQSAERLAHLTQGVEAKALRAVIAAYPDDIVLLVHDGWVSRKRLDKTRLVDVIREETSYEFELSEELLEDES